MHLGEYWVLGPVFNDIITWWGRIGQGFWSSGGHADNYRGSGFTRWDRQCGSFSSIEGLDKVIAMLESKGLEPPAETVVVADEPRTTLKAGALGPKGTVTVSNKLFEMGDAGLELGVTVTLEPWPGIVVGGIIGDVVFRAGPEDLVGLGFGKRRLRMFGGPQGILV
jgi:hypothetical protein